MQLLIDAKDNPPLIRKSQSQPLRGPKHDASSDPKRSSEQLHFQGDSSAFSKSLSFSGSSVHGDQFSSGSRPLSRTALSTPSKSRDNVESPSSRHGVPDWIARPPSPWTDAAFGEQNQPWFRNLLHSKQRTTQRLCAVTGHKKGFTPEECWSWPLAQVFSASPLRDRPGKLHTDQYREYFEQHRKAVKHDLDLASFIASTEAEVEQLQEAIHLSPEQQARLSKEEQRLPFMQRRDLILNRDLEMLMVMQKHRDKSIRRLDRLDESLLGVRKQHPSDKHLAISVARSVGARAGHNDANASKIAHTAPGVSDVQGGHKEMHRPSTVGGLNLRQKDPKRKAAISHTLQKINAPRGTIASRKSIDHAGWLRQRLQAESEGNFLNLEKQQLFLDDPQHEAPNQETAAAKEEVVHRETVILPGRPVTPLSPRSKNQHREERKRRRKTRVIELDDLIVNKASDSPRASVSNLSFDSQAPVISIIKEVP